MSAGLPLLVTRADPGGAASVARALAQGLDAYATPLFAAEALPWTPPDARHFDALLLTSAQAPRLAGPCLAPLAALPAYAVGAATARAAAGVGLSVAATGEADAQALIDAMTAQNVRRILWLCGRDRSDFDPRGAALTALPCYAVDPAEPTPVWRELIAAPAVVLAHSARGAARSAALAGAARGHLRLVAISAAAAAAAGEGWGEVAVATTPDDAAMLAQAHALCHKGQK
ncbi:MAG: uroporphyrinogen-III synthase [Sphingopyxis sp.]|uniref:uroporphyrinogen-III synthase n=1 Tax=Sphingopyxis sp. TaxID=1908224 RepID=UPI003D80D1DB